MNRDLPPHPAAAQARADAEAQARAYAGARLVLKGILLNGILAILKFAGGIFGHTYALIADGTESLLDVLSSTLVWAGLKVAALPADEDHPYGHGRAEPLAAMTVSLFIFVAAGFIAWHAVHVIGTPHEGPRWFTLPLLAGIITVKVWYSHRLGAASSAAGSTALGAESWHHASDAITSLAAFIGIGIAVVGGRGWESADGWAALFACAVVGFNGVVMVRNTLAEMMDTAVPDSVVNQVRLIAAAVDGVRALDKCRVRKSGLNHLVDIQVRVDGDLTVRSGHAIAHAVKDALLSSPLGVTDVSVHVEPML